MIFFWSARIKPDKNRKPKRFDEISANGGYSRARSGRPMVSPLLLWIRYRRRGEREGTRLAGDDDK